ncbi:hypothetical protein CDL15_Pgr028790 [Punica granatum]|uniref:Uncharacterized protein n=1 Tax=Punica granatum TaxID=22663 RepID=A0A218VYW4_PUNGR|nr:hypothetical protein CDL15_Pgr028790 [Punica granatum]
MMSTPLRLGIDISGDTDSFAAAMKSHNVTVLTATMNLNTPYSEAAALRGLLDLLIPQLLQIAKSSGSALRLGIDIGIGGGTGSFAAKMKSHNVIVWSTIKLRFA